MTVEDRATMEYTPRGAAAELWNARDQEVLIEGPARTGKSLGVIAKSIAVCVAHPKVRVLWVRATRESMSETVLESFERDLAAGTALEPMVMSQQRRVRQSYQFPNGSAIVIGGMDNATKFMSGRYDMVCCFEATELYEADYEYLLTRLCNYRLTVQQAICDCNPSAPGHWLNQRAASGKMRRLLSRHQDNPMLWQDGDWTEAGRDYIARLSLLTGARRDRLLHGRWVQAEGVVYPEYDPAIHRIDRFDGEVGRFASVDWGFTNPGVIQAWAMDGDGRVCLVDEVYRTQRTIEWWVGEARRMAAAGVQDFICDPARPEFIQQFRDAGLSASEANNDIELGIQKVQERLRVAGDGKPRLFFLRSCLRQRDESLAEKGLPAGTVAEFDSYVYPTGKPDKNAKEVPVDANNHGMDALRYAVMHADGASFGPLRMEEVQDE